jgi:uncharacterized protein
MQPPRLLNDFAAIFAPQQQLAIEQKLRIYHDSTSTQIYVVTLANTDGYSLAQLSPLLFEQWGIGQKDKNNGLLILVKPKRGAEHGDVFIGTGYGMEGVLPDAICKRIIELEMLPHFRTNDYFSGINAAVDAIISAAAGEYRAVPKANNGAPSRVIPLLVLALLIAIFIAGRKGNGKGNGGSKRNNSGLFFLPFLWGSGRRSSGGFGSGGFGGMGGFGGGGGGRSGGGGAGGRW